MELSLILDMATADDPERVAVVDSTGRSLTRGQLRCGASAAAARWRAHDASTVGYLGTSHVAFALALFGAAAAGIPFVPFNFRLSDAQLSQITRRHDRLVVVTDEPSAARRDAIADAASIDRDEFVDDVLAAGATDVGRHVDPDDVALLLYTSGTTSAPKAAVLRHRHLTSYVLGTVEFGSAGVDDAVLVSVPPYHIAGVSNLLSNLYSGRRVVYLDPFDASRWLAIVADERISHAMVVPTMLARIVDALGGREGPPIPSLAYGGSTVPLPVLERALQLFPQTAFTNAYGLTETSSTIAVLGPDDHRDAFVATPGSPARRRLGSVGRPLPGIDIEVRDDRGRALPAGQAGDVHVRGEQVSGEYVGIGSSVDCDGWFPTRDRGFLDDSGYLFIEGRADDTIIRGGENIAPAEVEDVLLRHPAIAECAVVGIPDDEWGQRIAAVVVTDPGVVVDDAELRAFALEHLRSSKTPDVIIMRDALPYTTTGKLLRREVRGWVEESIGTEPVY